MHAPEIGGEDNLGRVGVLQGRQIADSPFAGFLRRVVRNHRDGRQLAEIVYQELSEADDRGGVSNDREPVLDAEASYD